MILKIEILGQKFAHFGRFGGSFLTILGVKKVDFWTFSKLFWTCLGSVWALFSASKSLLLVVFSGLKVDNWPWKLRFWVKILLILVNLRGEFWPFWRLKSRFLHFFKVVLDLFRKCLGFVFGVKRPIFVLFTTRNWVSPLGSREALINIDKASPGLFIFLQAFLKSR